MTHWVSESHPFRSRPLGSADDVLIRQLFQKVFRQEMSEALWKWKYADGRATAMLVFRGDELVAHYGGLDREILFKGRPMKVVQIADVMVDPSVRQSVRTQSPFFIVCKDFQEVYVGENKRYAFGFGFPNKRHLKLAERLGLYAGVGEMLELSWQTRQFMMPGLSYKIETINVSNVERLREKINRLWRQFARHFKEGLVGIKNAEHIKRRFLDHPEKKYGVFLISNRFTAKPVAVMVLIAENDRLLLLDVVADLSKLKSLLAVAINIAHKSAKKELASWVPKAYVEAFNCHDARINDLDIQIPTNIWSKGPDPEQINNKWWLMAGDTDFL